MPIPLSLSEFKVVGSQPKITRFVRVVPAPKSFVLPVAWEEAAGPARPVPVMRGTAVVAAPCTTSRDS